MAIAGAMKVAGKALGKAVKVIKKKKKELETTKAGTKIKETATKAGSKVKETAAKTGEKLQPTVEKIKKGVRTASVKARRTAGPKGREGVRKAAQVTAAGGIGAAGVAAATAATPTLMGAGVGAGLGAGLSKDPWKGFKRGGVVGGALGLAATAGLTASLFKSNTVPEQLYNYEKMGDGRIAINFKGGNTNTIFSARHLNPKEVDDIKTRLAILDSIVLSTDPKSRSKEFKQQVGYLATKYKISNITGKNLSIIIPNVKGGVQTRQG